LEGNGQIIVAGASGSNIDADCRHSAHGRRIAARRLQRRRSLGRLWRNNATGENYIYPMDGTAILGGEGYVRTVADTSTFEYICK